MSNRTYALVILVLSSCTLPAQEEGFSRLFGMQAGTAIPFSEFSGKSFDDRYSGFATPGGTFQAEFINQGSNISGFSVNIGYSWMGFDTKAYTDEYFPVLNDPMLSVQTGNYHMARISFGWVLKAPVSEGLRVMIVPGIGAAAIWHPEIMVTGTEYGILNSIERSTGYSGTVGLEIKLGYDITDHLCAALCYSLNYASPYLQDSTSPEGSFWLPMQFHGLNIGVYYIFENDGQ